MVSAGKLPMGPFLQGQPLRSAGRSTRAGRRMLAGSTYLLSIPRIRA